MDTQQILVWLQYADGSWHEIAVAAEHYRSVVDLSRGPNGDRSISLVEMPERRRAVG